MNEQFEEKNYIKEYYEKICSGEIKANKFITKLYKHLNEIFEDENSEYRLDLNLGCHPIWFIEKYCVHIKGSKAGKPLILELWQKALVQAIFGIVRKDNGKRRFRRIFLLVARKHGKSLLSAAIALYSWLCLGEGDPDLFSVSTTKDASRLTWNVAKKMIMKNPALRECIKPLHNTLVGENGFDGEFKPLASDSDTLDGLNAFYVSMDEIHALKGVSGIELYDVMLDSQVARDEPLFMMITTAGTQRDGIFDKIYNESVSIINGYSDPNMGFKDDTLLPIMYCLDNKEEIDNEEMWIKANPGIDTIVNRAEIRRKYISAKRDGNLSNILCKHFNVRTLNGEAYFNFDDINSEVCNNDFDISDKKFKYYCGGVDLSETGDLTAAVAIMRSTDKNDPKIYVETMCWIPQNKFDYNVENYGDNVPYDIWHDKGYLRISGENKIVQSDITQWFLEIQEKYGVMAYKIGYDKAYGAYWIKEMEQTFGKAAMECVRQGSLTFTGPLKDFKLQLKDNNICYKANPILKWCMSNVCVETDKNGGVRPIKPGGITSSTKKIDAFMALLDAYVVMYNLGNDYLDYVYM